MAVAAVHQSHARGRLRASRPASRPPGASTAARGQASHVDAAPPIHHRVAAAAGRCHATHMAPCRPGLLPELLRFGFRRWAAARSRQARRRLVMPPVGTVTRPMSLPPYRPNQWTLLGFQIIIFSIEEGT